MDLLLSQVDGELALVNGDLVRVDDSRAIVQDLAQVLRFFLGEWFLDTTQGVPYYQQILVKDPDLVAIQGLLLAAITGRPGIKEVTDFQFAYDNLTRKLSVTFEARSVAGPVSYSTQLEVAA